MSVSIHGVDYSDARPGGAALAKAGVKFAARYLYPPVTGGKGLSQSEVTDLTKHGIAIAVVFEGAAGGARRGRGQGIQDAAVAQSCLNKLSLDHKLPIYFAVDFDATPADQTAIDAYLSGAASVIGHDRVGVYGGYWVITRCQSAKSASWFWETYAWSGGNVAKGIHLFQYDNGQSIAGSSVDFTRALQAEYGQHAPAAAAAPAPFKEDIVILAREKSHAEVYGISGTSKVHLTAAQATLYHAAGWRTVEVDDGALAAFTTVTP